MASTQFEPRTLTAADTPSAVWRTPLSASGGSDRRPISVDLSALLCHLIDSVVDDEAFEKLPDHMARLGQGARLNPAPSAPTHKRACDLKAIDRELGLSKTALNPPIRCAACNPDPDDLGGLDLFAAPLTRVLQARRQLAAQALNLAQAVLDDQIDAVVVVDVNGVPQFANASAMRLLETSDILTLNAGRISSREPLILSSLRKLLRSASKGRGGDLVFPPHVVGYRGSVEPLQGATAPLVCIRLRDDKAWAAARADQARLLHGLTAAETRLAEALLLGLTPADIADQRNVSMPTVRTQLRSLYAKTGVTGQAALKKALERV